MVNVLPIFVPELTEEMLLVVDMFDIPKKEIFPAKEEAFVAPSRDKIVVEEFVEEPDDPAAATRKSIFEEVFPVDEEMIENVPPLLEFALIAAMAVPEMEIFVFGIDV